MLYEKNIVPYRNSDMTLLSLTTVDGIGYATVLKRIFRDKFVIFLRRSKKNSIFGIGEFTFVCMKFLIFVMVT